MFKAIKEALSLLFYRPMKTLYIIRGLPGSGKSTLASKMATTANTTYVENDQFMYNDKGEYEWTQERLAAAIDLSYDAIYHKITRNETVVIVNGVFSRWSAIRDYVELAQAYNYHVHIIECKGQFQNIHGTPPEMLDKMRRKFIPNSGLPQKKDIEYGSYNPN